MYMAGILAVTGRLAEQTIRGAVADTAEVLVLDVDVAAFTTAAKLRERIDELKGYDLILVSGMTNANFDGLEDELGIPIRLGPKHAHDIGTVLEFIDEVPLSKDVPACELIADRLREDALKSLRKIEESASAPINVRGLKIGGNSRMKVLAEVVDADSMAEEKLTARIGYYLSEGADIIGLGIGLEAEPGGVQRAVQVAKKATDAPISIYTVDAGLIMAGAGAGADIIFSLNAGNMHEVGARIAEYGMAAVVVPDDESLESLVENISTAREAGIKQIIADPLLSPAGYGMTKSIVRHYRFREMDASTPLFFGAGNVTELIDADSVGVNAVLAGIASELGAGILFTPERSHKCRGSVRELRKAADMMALARERHSSPKDLGIDLLWIKEKHSRAIERSIDADGKVIEARAKGKWKSDPEGFIRIFISDNKIAAQHKSGAVVGDTAEEVLDTLLENGIVSRTDHAAYLGRELMKAELALRYRRSYVQDDEF